MTICKKLIPILCIIALIAPANLIAQKAKKKTTRIRVEYFKISSKGETLVATLRIKEKRYLPFSNAEVAFYSINDSSRILLQKVRSNKKGEAIYKLDENSNINKDSLGFMTFEVDYVGDASTKDTHRKISIKQANLEVSFFQKDTIKYIEVDVNELSNGEQFVPLEDLEVSFYIKGTFSELIFAKEETGENGKVIVEFPVDMPGDTLGILTIITKVEEDKVYGTIESRGKINWGIPVALADEKLRGLGDTDAPLWMVYTLITLLSAVWFHYLYVIFLIVKIKMAKRSF